MDLKRFGANIRDIRNQQGTTQEKLAALADLDRSYLGGIERGERNVSFRNIIKIAEALRVHPGLLFKEETEASTWDRYRPDPEGETMDNYREIRKISQKLERLRMELKQGIESRDLSDREVVNLSNRLDKLIRMLQKGQSPD